MFAVIDSTVPLAKETEVYTAAHLGYLSSVFPGVNRYVVSPQTMDRLYPPRKRLSLEDECIRRILIEHNFIENTEEFWFRWIENCIRKTNLIVAVGLYLSKIPSDIAQDLNIPQNEHSIFICPERVRSWSGKVSQALKLNNKTTEKYISTMVILHELAHAYMDGGKQKGTFYEKVIEESLANAVAYDLLASNIKNRAVLRYAISLQPLEYRAYTFWQYKVKSILDIDILNMWRDRDLKSYNRKLERLYYNGWRFCYWPDHFIYLYDLLYYSGKDQNKAWQNLAFYILKSIAL